MTHNVLVVRWDDRSGKLVAYVQRPGSKEPQIARDLEVLTTSEGAFSVAKRILDNVVRSKETT
jgi:hypothetical protein